MRAYAKQADNRDLEADAIEIRMRATRRMDQLRQEQAKTIGLAKGTRGTGRPKKGGLPKNPPKTVPTLADAGIDKNLANEGRKLGAMSTKEFEKAVTTAREAIGRVVKQALRTDDKTERRAIREQQLASTSTSPTGLRKQRKIQMVGGIGSQLNSEKRANLDIGFRA
jgi:hypothetical protein